MAAMRTPLFEQLELALSGSYSLESEMGGGGMSHVYIAVDSTLGRRVVVKVLPPDLGVSLSVERFHREIRVTASLQHPHIVPVLTAGHAGELLYYTMPLVLGESLRQRLARESRLTVAHAEQVVRDVLQALAYAHRHGVVHRDIKPENILLTDDGAMVTDFGIAKAVQSSAKTGDKTVESTLTGIGVTLGTPSYMAPEQLAADHTADQRVDVYASGIVFYECLTGTLPFAEEPAHRRLAARLTRTPTPVHSLRGDVPRQVSDFVQRCLAPEPKDRPESAQVALDQLDNAVAASPSPRRRLVPKRLAIAASILIALLSVGAWAATGPMRVPLATARLFMTRPAAALKANRIVVAPFAPTPDDPSLRALGAMLADYVAQGLSVLPRVEVVDARSTMINAEVVSRIPRLLRGGDRDVALAKEAGARVVLTGHVYRDGDSLRADAVIRDAESGVIRQTLGSFSAPAGATTRLIDAVRRRAVAAVMQASDTAAFRVDFGVMSAPPSLDAYAMMRLGLRQMLRWDSTAVETLRRAAALDTGWVTPRLLLVFAASNAQSPALADSAIGDVRARLERATTSERALFEMHEANFRADRAAGLAAAEEVLRLSPGSAEVQLLVASQALNARRPSRAIEVTEAMDPNRGLNLGSGFYWRYRSVAFLRMGNYPQALATALEGARRFGDERFGRQVVAAIAGMKRHAQLQVRIEQYARASPSVAVARGALTETAVMWLMRVGDSASARRMAVAALADADLTSEAALDSRAALMSRVTLGVVARDITSVRQALARIIASERSGTYAGTWLNGLAAALSGDSTAADRAETTLGRMTNRYDFGWSPYHRAQIAALSGHRERAVRLLADAEANGYPFNAAEGFAPELDPLLVSLHGYPPFQRLVAPNKPTR